MMRMDEPGWIRIIPFDSAGRRSMWVRITSDKIECCAGREGDDAYCVLYLNGNSSEVDVLNLEEVVKYALCAMEQTHDDD